MGAWRECIGGWIDVGVGVGVAVELWGAEEERTEEMEPRLVMLSCGDGDGGGVFWIRGRQSFRWFWR